MITLNEAIKRVLDDAGDGMALDDANIIEKDYGWILFPNSKEYIETGDFMKMAIGSGGVLVLKENGRIIKFGSAFGLETNLKIYELGYLDSNNWDIVITKIRAEQQAIDLILRLSATYIVPEIEAGVEWRIPKTYKSKQIKDMLQNLPLRLNIGGIYFNYEFIELLKSQKFFEYRLEPNNGYTNFI